MPGLPVPVIFWIAIGLGLHGMINGLLVWKLEHPADRGDARHDDHLPRHHLPDLGR
jgi:hypothetical protein